MWTTAGNCVPGRVSVISPCYHRYRIAAPYWVIRSYGTENGRTWAKSPRWVPVLTSHQGLCTSLDSGDPKVLAQARLEQARHNHNHYIIAPHPTEAEAGSISLHAAW